MRDNVSPSHSIWWRFRQPKKTKNFKKKEIFLDFFWGDGEVGFGVEGGTPLKSLGRPTLLAGWVGCFLLGGAGWVAPPTAGW